MTRLTPTSYVVLGLLRDAGESTPYGLKQMVSGSGVGDLWNLQHAQLYAEPERLARAGLLDEEIEGGGRRRKTYRLTDAGREALDAWLAEPTSAWTELRDPGLLRLWFGADPLALAVAQREVHERKLVEYEQVRDEYGDELARGPRLVLDAGIGHQREYVRFWTEIERRAR